MNEGPCWAEISLPQLKDNLNIIRRHVGPARKLLAVVKADAYGHGAVRVARALEEAGVDFMGVAAVDEGVELRQAGIRTPILVLTGFFPGEEQALVEHDITPGITEPDQVARLEQVASAAGRKLRCHVKVDTGMGRLGISCDEAAAVGERLAGNPHLELEGLYTHFAASEDFASDQTQQQVERFEKARAAFAARGLEPPLIHLANTGGVAARPETWGTMVRPGSILYGFISFFHFPEGQDRTAEIHAALPVQPVLTLKARVFMVRDYPANASLGYGARFVTRRPSRIAVLPVGYGHGWRRGLSNNCRIILRGEFAPMVGTIGMDLTLADVTDVPGAQDGDEVILIGTNGKVAIPPTEPARALGTVASEVLSGLTKRIPRVYCE
jgi:alanine racemase